MGELEKVGAVIKAMLDGEPLQSVLGIGPIYSSNQLFVEISDEGYLSICVTVDEESQCEFAISDFAAARRLAAALNAWADHAEANYRTAEDELRRRRREMGLE